MDALSKLLNMAYEQQRMKLGLQAITQAHKNLGSPANCFKTVHVAGTNGKGSVCLKIATGLQEKGYRVGLYTSPHLFDIRERVCINGEKVHDLEHFVEAILPLNLTYFETLTLAAFQAFAHYQVDYAVIEVGLGGAADATNIITPQLSVITSIGWDHMAHLGPTLEAIAEEKAGIIKPAVPVVVGPQTQPWHVFEKKAASLQAPLFKVQGHFAHFEEQNQAVAQLALQQLGIQGSHQALLAVPACRFQQLGRVIIDVGHNLSALEALFQRLHVCFPEKKFRVLAAFSADKAIEEMLQFLSSQALHVHLTQAEHPRAHRFHNKNIQQSFEEALQLATENDEILVVCGTFFMMQALALSHVV
ncbi:MAG: bifunctional folylpolyglutamate synthase/dihydrofolate synthase [Verrucomicrobia bacterium]|nr:bifunctional folylpolyglutamate synthase/dihydrofolate synthase [Verrucomicrobiota bacterium]MBS0647498.1 bifunctional folylpolyglutamate synthase/dihydrofolate synthase [Verrucomicrobiota bacterium]